MSYAGIETAIYSLLIADTDVSSFVGSKVYPVVIPQDSTTKANTYPCVSYKRTGTERQFTLEGNSGLATASIDIEVYSTSYSEVKELAKLVRVAMLSFIATSTADHLIDGCFLNDEQDNYYFDVTVEGKSGIYSVTLLYSIVYQEESYGDL